MRLRLFLIAGLCLANLAAFIGFGPTHRAEAQATPTVAVAPNRYIVRLKTAPELNAAYAAAEFEEAEGVSIDHVYQSAFPGFAGTFTPAAVKKLLTDPQVASVSPDFILTASDALPSGIDRVDADLNPTHAGNGSGSVSVDVAVLDTGVYKHSELNVVGGKDCIYGTNPYSDAVGHGTHVAGTIGAEDNGSGIVGVAPGARIWAVKVLDNTGSGTDSSVICGLDYVASKSGTIDVVNMSLGGNSGAETDSCGSSALHYAICAVYNAGVTMVVAAGNDGADSRFYAPAQYNEVVTVSALTDLDGRPGALAGCWYVSGYNLCDDTFAGFSNYGPDVDIAAPGVAIYSTASGGGYLEESGTSMASPHVTGAAALIIAQKGHMSPANVRARLILTASPGPIPNDPDSSHEPILNVAMLGTGKLVVPSSVHVGDVLQVRTGDFTPGSRVTFRFDGTFIGGDNADDAGRASRNYTIPAMAAGTYQVVASNSLKTVTANVKVLPKLTVSPNSGPVGTTVTIKLRGFQKSESVKITMATGGSTATLGTVTTSSGGGSADLTVAIPASTKGTHKVTATGNKGSSTSTNYATGATATISDATLGATQKGSITIRGFASSETVRIRWDSQGGQELGSVTTSSTGSASIQVALPAGLTNGTHYFWVISSSGIKIRLTISVSGVAEEGSEPTSTPTAVPSQTAVPSATATQQPDATLAPTETAMPEATATEAATEAPVDATVTETVAPVEPTATDTPADPAVEGSPGA